MKENKEKIFLQMEELRAKLRTSNVLYFKAKREGNSDQEQKHLNDCYMFYDALCKLHEIAR